MQLKQLLINDNFIHFIVDDNNQSIVIDPGYSDEIMDYIQKNNLTVNHILITHHHADHTNGIKTLLQRFPELQVTGPEETEQFNHNTYKPDLNNFTSISANGLDIHILPGYGHTLNHILYYVPEYKWLFSGDCLFNLGAGKIFEGTPDMYVKTMDYLKELPSETKIFSGHNYIQSNLKFCKSLPQYYDDDNLEQLAQETLKQDIISTTMNFEMQYNPFLNYDNPVLQNHHNITDDAPATFKKLRELKNSL